MRDNDAAIEEATELMNHIRRAAAELDTYSRQLIEIAKSLKDEVDKGGAQ